MTDAPGLLLVLSVAIVGVLHTVVPDHWVPITLLARQRGWSKAETARAALQAGTGHVVTTLIIGLAVWAAGVAFATRFGHIVDTAASVALIAFGGWIGISAWRELRGGPSHGHSHGGLFGSHHHHEEHDGHAAASGSIYGPELHSQTCGAHRMVTLMVVTRGAKDCLWVTRGVRRGSRVPRGCGGHDRRGRRVHGGAARGISENCRCTQDLRRAIAGMCRFANAMGAITTTGGPPPNPCRIAWRSSGFLARPR
jgi:hypothetical protein